MKLRNRITIGTILLLVLTISLLGYYSINHIKRILVQEDSNWSATMAKAVAKAITTDTIEGHRPAVRKVLKRVIETNQELSYLMVVDFNGDIFTSTFDGKLPDKILSDHINNSQSIVTEYQLNETTINDYKFPLINGLDANLHIGVNKQVLNKRIAEASLKLFYIAIFIIITGSLLAIFFSRKITEPLSQLSNSIQAYAEDRLDKSHTNHTSGIKEIDSLSDNFKKMVENKNAADLELTLLKNSLDQTLDCIFMFDCKELKFFYVNQGAMNQIGYSYDELMRMTPYDIKPDYDEVSFRELIKPFIDGEIKSTTFQTLHQHKNGNTIPVEIFLQYIPIKDNERFIAVIKDISERIENERKLMQLNEELEQRVEERTARIRQQARILDQIHDSVITTDLAGTITSWNKGATHLFGYTADEAIGKNISFVYPADQQDFLQKSVIKPLLKHGTHEVEVQMIKKSGLVFYALLSQSLTYDDNNDLNGMVGYSLDITERKLIEYELRKAKTEAETASRSKTDFLSRMSHELRTPMNAILGFSQILEQNIAGNLSEDELSCVREVLKGGNHLMELINEVLDLSRVESGRLQVSVEAIEICHLLNDTITLIKPLAEKRSITITNRTDDDTYVIHGDRMRLKQVIINILSNAVKYNRKEGKINIDCKQVDNLIRLSIQDTGPGIPGALHSRVFEPFDRLNADTTTIEGTGIGLSLAKRLVEFMNGKIGFESTEGEGTTFWVDMPVGNKDTSSEKELKKSSNQLEVDGNFNILYVEDNPANLRLVRKLLDTHDGITLVDTHSASLAFDLIHTRHFDLILLDIHLPGDEDGFDILHRLRAEPDTRNIPVIAVSANATQHDIKKGLAKGFNEYMTKPIDISSFTKVINNYLVKVSSP